DQNVTTGTLASLNGSSSSDADGDSLTYLWSTTSKPNGSASSLSSTTAANPQFSADVDGQYTFQLVVNDGELNSSPDSVTVTSSTANSAPTANAGPDQNVTTSFLATLDGSASSDADGDPLSYSWTITSKPSGSASTISFSTDVDAFFTPDRDGQYVFQLIVNDGHANSAPDSITVTSSGDNSPPTANAGADQTVLVGDVAQLDSSNSSDADGDPLSYSWSFVSKPNGSVSALSDATQASPTFLTDQAGSYVLSLVVSDGTENSNPDSVTITASAPKVRLYTKGNSIFDPTENEVGFPYSSQGTNNSSIIGSDVITLGEFRLEALGTDFNVTSLQAIDRNGIVAPRFVGLVNGDTVSAGSSISFKLETPKTNNQQADLLFSFTIQETGETFSFQRLVKTN
ncbi:PKD domain-containing protein, partial [Zhongshania marina]